MNTDYIRKEWLTTGAYIRESLDDFCLTHRGTSERYRRSGAP